jgi:hypothetical protein
MGRESTNPSRAEFYMHVPGRTMTDEGAGLCRWVFCQLPNLRQALLQALKLQTNLRLHSVL